VWRRNIVGAAHAIVLHGSRAITRALLQTSSAVQQEKGQQSHLMRLVRTKALLILT
jgi:hypothetical protein